MANSWLLAPFDYIHKLALAMCVRKNCWLKDLKHVSVDELYAQADIMKEQNDNG